MTLQDAIKTGLSFKRHTYVNWIDVRGDNLKWDDDSIFIVGPNELLADDWEIKETRKNLSLKDIMRAVEEASSTTYNKEQFLNVVAIKLGFSFESTSHSHSTNNLDLVDKIPTDL